MKKVDLHTVVFNWNRTRGETTVPLDHKKIVKQHIRQANTHFKKDGWDLDFSIIKARILDDILGYDVSAAMIDEIIKNRELMIVGRDSKLLIHKKTTKEKRKK